MLRKRLVALTLAACTAFASSFLWSSHARAADASEDEDSGDDRAQGGGGQLSGVMAASMREFKAKRWEKAALGFFNVMSGKTDDDETNKALGMYYLAVSLYQMRFYQPSFAMFSFISSKKDHPKFRETLLWLSKLSTQLPEAADIVERVGKYGQSELAQFDNGKQKKLFWTLNYLLGSYKYRNRQFTDAISLFNKVSKESKHYVKSQFLAGVSYVQLRKSVPAVQSFQRVVKALDEGAQVADAARLRDLAYLSMARTYYSASIQLDPDSNAPKVNEERLTLAVKNWDLVAQGSEYWLDALFEESWAYFMAGLYPKVLGNIHTIQSPYFPNAFYPESDVLKAVVFFSNCNYEAAGIVVARFKEKYGPIRTELEKVMNRFKGEKQEGPFFQFLKDVKEGKGDLDPKIRFVVKNALGDRQLLRHIEYVRILDKEIERYKKLPRQTRDSALGEQIKKVLKVARDQAVRKAGQLAMSRYERNMAELKEHLRNGEKLKIDITAAKRNLIDQKLKDAMVTDADAKVFGVVNPDEEHMLWPFDGEYWRDELGFYRQVVESACGR